VAGPPAWVWIFEPPLSAIISGVGTYATTLTDVLVTPGAVAPPLFLPAGHGFTQNGPPPTVLKLVWPFGAQLSWLNAAFDPRPNPAGCGPVPWAFSALWAEAADSPENVTATAATTT